MSNKNKNKNPADAAPAPPPAEARPPAAGSPPGTVASNGHGPQRPVVDKLFGENRLRAALSVSADVRIDHLCDDAAAEIERLRDAEGAGGQGGLGPWPDDE